MDNDKIEKIIELVRSHVYLYDLSHQQFKNASFKAAVWESIGEEINETGAAVKNKWRTIRDGYAKYKKQIKDSTGSGNPYIWGSHLAFLDDCNSSKPRKFRKNETASQRLSTQDFSITKDMASPPSTSSFGRSQAVPAASSLATTSTIADNLQRSRKRPLQNKADDDDDINDITRIIQYFDEKHNEKKLDVIDNLFLSYADTFKKFPPREQAMVKLELAKLFSDFELRLYNSAEQSNNLNTDTAESAAYTNAISIESIIPSTSNQQIKEEDYY